MRQLNWRSIAILFAFALISNAYAESNDDELDPTSDGATFIGDSAAIDMGRQLYGNTCLFCHGAKGVGARAPTLVAGAWAPGRGNDAEYMFETVMQGRPGTIMGAFNEMLQPKEIWQIVAYLRDQADALAANK